MFAAIVGGVEHPRERLRCVEEIVKRSSDISGYVLAGFSNGETRSQRNKAVEETVQKLPATKPRMLECVTDVLGALDAIALGIDLVAWSYPDALTDACCAATFDVSDTAKSKAMMSKICLRDASYARDVRPLVEGCTCYACKYHTKAYIHHLVVVHEILGQALLDHHNWHHAHQWFHTIRTNIENGTFAEYNQTFRNNFTRLNN